MVSFHEKAFANIFIYTINNIYVCKSFTCIFSCIHSLAVTLEPASESYAVCINSNLKITCTINSTNSIILAWMLIPGQENSSNIDPESYSNSLSMEMVKMIGDFVLRLASNNPLISTATLDPVKLKHNGTVLRCANHIVYEKANESTEIIIILKGKLYMLFLYMYYQSM